MPMSPDRELSTQPARAPIEKLFMRMKDDPNRSPVAPTEHAHERGHAAPGKRTLTNSATYAVQRRESSEPQSSASPSRSPSEIVPVSSEQSFVDSIVSDTPSVQLDGAGSDAATVHALAEQGTSGATESLPFMDQIQRSFGEHDVSGIKAHRDPAAVEASRGMGARAFAVGDHVGFGGEPDLHTAAHEAAHVVQQRAGVQLAGGVGVAGDVYERNADAVADAVVRGDSAATLLGSPDLGGANAEPGHATSRGADVQRQAAGGGAAQPVTVTVTWSSPFGNNLSGTVTLRGRNDAGDAWTRIESQDVDNTNTVTFANARRFRRYQATIQPVDDVEDDGDAVGKFKKTVLPSGNVAASADETEITGGLELNRWNRDNVSQRHRREGIDPDEASEANILRVPLFGRSVRVHRLVAPRVERTNALYEALPQRDKDEIAASLFVTGGYAYRNQVGKRGAFSDHSVGMAVDVNYNEGKTQNALMESTEEKELLELVFEPVVRSSPAHAAFDVWMSKSQDQLAASKAFNERFPEYLADLLDRDDDVARLQATEQAVADAMTQSTILSSAAHTGHHRARSDRRNAPLKYFGCRSQDGRRRSTRRCEEEAAQDHRHVLGRHQRLGAGHDRCRRTQR